ncbi:hypothetical protein DY954_07595 [Pseudomonas aeruginosa]|uniref:hypothetical protein n=1 Tax=Pseudomonas aeruginosa TaxID=287 RepID=UPI000F83FD60|nr:hypothetical protein [Pseudomonas aeruginosa]RTT13491.1 hypothetical protein DY954_07595 [Pseudomonas aeruginosa]
MSTSPVFDEEALSRLAERTEYEAWLLEEVYTLVEQELFFNWPDAVVYPLDTSQAQYYRYGRGNIILGDWRPGFLNAGAPLVFVSTFKLLDMLIEWILEENGMPSTFRFQEKLKKLNDSPIFPQFIETRSWLKERLIGLYGSLEPLRGTIIHNKSFSTQDGSLRVSSTKRGAAGPVSDISAAKLRSLAFTIVSVLRYLHGNWPLDAFREKVLRFELDGLLSLHELPLLGQKRPFHTRVRLYRSGSDPFNFDPAEILDGLAEKNPDQDCSFDVRILLVDGGQVVKAYFFPWSIIAPLRANWHHGIDSQKYIVELPDDIDSTHVAVV